MTPWQAAVEGIRRVAAAPGIVAGLWLMTLMAAAPLGLGVRGDIERHLGSSTDAALQVSGATYDWFAEFSEGSSGLSSTFGPQVIGFAAVVDNLSARLDGTPRPAMLAALGASYAGLWIFLSGGLVERLALGQPLGAAAFFRTCGSFGFRLLRLAAVSGVLYAVLFARVRPWLLDQQFERLTEAMDSERSAFFVRLALYAAFIALLAAVNLWFDYAKIRLVVEKRLSVIGALRAGGRVIRRKPASTVALYCLDALLLGAALAIYSVIAPGAHSTGLAFGLGQAYVAVRIALKLTFWASEAVWFQSNRVTLSCPPDRHGGSMTALTNLTMTKTNAIALAVVLCGTALFAQAPPFKRTMLHQRDLSVAGREVVLGKAEFPKGTSTGKHTHPGEESSYVSEGTMSIVMDGAAKTYKAGEAFFIPAGVVHDAINIDAGNSTVIANYIVEKGKPLTTPVK